MTQPHAARQLHLGLWRNDSEGRPDSYLRDSNGQPVYSGNVSITAAAYSISNTDFNLSNEDLQHIMHGLSLKSTRANSTGNWPPACTTTTRTSWRRHQSRWPIRLAEWRQGPLVNQGGTGWNT
jgi:iron complex outermembrane receptor protein